MSFLVSEFSSFRVVRFSIFEFLSFRVLCFEMLSVRV